MRNSSKPTIGRVESVYTTDGMVYVNVQRDRPGQQETEIPFMSLTPGTVLTPQEGDLVELYEIDGGGSAARFAQSKPSFSMPEIGENEMVFKFDESTEISVQKDASGQYEVRISAGAKVFLGNSSGIYAPVARKGDPVSVDTTSGDGTITDGSSNVESS